MELPTILVNGKEADESANSTQTAPSRRYDDWIGEMERAMHPQIDEDK